MTSDPISSWHIERKKLEAVADFIFLGSKTNADSDCTTKLKDPCSLEEKL